MFFWLWIAVLVGAVIIEFATSTALVSIWFAVGAVAGLIANQFGLSLPMQTLIFTIVSILFIVCMRPLATRHLRGNLVPTNADRVIGQRTHLLKPIREDEWGEVKILGSYWSCTSVDGKPIEDNAHVEIVAIEGSKVLVKKIGG